jgi:hypothetical protein
MLTTNGNTKFRWICGKDVALEHSTTDEHGLSVHNSCHATTDVAEGGLDPQ